MRFPISRPQLFFDIGQVWIASTLANLLLYLFHLIVGRSLGPEDYSLFGALFGLIYMAGALAGSVQISVARLVAESRASGDGRSEGSLVSSSMLQMLLLGGVFLIAFSLVSPFIRSFLHSDSIVPILVTGIAISISLLLPVARGALQGSQRFPHLAALLLVHAGSRLVFGLAALGLGFGMTGVLAAVGLSSVIATVMGLAAVRPSRTLSLEALPTRTFAKVLVPTLVASVAISFPTTADVFVVRHFFSATDAGLYTGASILGRVVLFLPLAVSVVLFPKMTEDWTHGNSGRGFLYQGLGLTALMSGSVSLGLVLFPRLALTKFLGSDYADAESLVPLYAGGMFFFSLAIVFLYYHLAIGQTAYVYLLLLPHIALELVLIYVFHQSLTQVVLVLLSVHVSLVASSLFFMRSMRGRHTENVREETLSLGTPGDHSS